MTPFSLLPAALALLAGLAGPLPATGQTAPAAAAPPVANNPLYTAPPASLTADQVAALQQPKPGQSPFCIRCPASRMGGAFLA